MNTTKAADHDYGERAVNSAVRRLRETPSPDVHSSPQQRDQHARDVRRVLDALEAKDIALLGSRQALSRDRCTPYLNLLIRGDDSDEIVAAKMESDAAAKAAAKAESCATLLYATDRCKRAQANLGRLLLARDKAARPEIYAK